MPKTHILSKIDFETIMLGGLRRELADIDVALRVLFDGVTTHYCRFEQLHGSEFYRIRVRLTETLDTVAIPESGTQLAFTRDCPPPSRPIMYFGVVALLDVPGYDFMIFARTESKALGTSDELEHALLSVSSSEFLSRYVAKSLAQHTMLANLPGDALEPGKFHFRSLLCTWSRSKGPLSTPGPRKIRPCRTLPMSTSFGRCWSEKFGVSKLLEIADLGRALRCTVTSKTKAMKWREGYQAEYDR